jgi:hypothetical protein
MSEGGGGDCHEEKFVMKGKRNVNISKDACTAEASSHKIRPT